jgi:homoserine dehydrogenase
MLQWLLVTKLPVHVFDNYKKLKEVCLANTMPFLFETNVGAGLPHHRYRKT